MEGFIRWGEAGGKGRGVFAVKNIDVETVVEESPVQPFPKSDMDLGRKYETVLGRNQLWWSDRSGEECALGSGYLMLYNHSDHPNVSLVRDYERKTIRVITTRPVVAGEELVHKYRSGTWFDVKE